MSWIKRIGSFILLTVICLGASVANGYAVTFPNKPPSTSYIVDNAKLLQAGQYNEINKMASALWQEKRIPIYVVTISSLAEQQASEYSIENYATALFNQWGIGSKQRNVGVLLLISKGDRKARIEFGADMGHKYDAEAQDIMSKLIIPQFKQGNFSVGVLDGVRGLDALMRGLDLPQPTPPVWLYPVLIGGFLLIVFVIVSLFRSGKSGWGWGLIILLGMIIGGILYLASKGGGSGGGFGGGSSGGGGATGSW